MAVDTFATSVNDKIVKSEKGATQKGDLEAQKPSGEPTDVSSPLLEPDVPFRADARELCDLLAQQAGRPPGAAGA